MFDVKRLNIQEHDRRKFDCGDQRLNEWLRRHSKNWMKFRATVAYVAIKREVPSEIVGFYALSAGTVKLAELPEAYPQKKRLPTGIEIPSILLGQLAVDRKHQKCGVGLFLLFDAMRKSIEASDLVGVQLLEVVAISESARNFYLHHGFESLEDDKNHLYLSMKSIAEAIEEFDAQPVT